MIKLSVNKKYKSILETTQFLDLPDFSIITGENGSGKTQLFEAIRNESITLIDYDGNKIVSDVSNEIVWRNNMAIQQANYGEFDTEHIASLIYDNYVNNESINHNYNDKLLNSKEIAEIIKRDFKTDNLDMYVVNEWVSRHIYKTLPFDTSQIKRIFSTYYRLLVNNLVSKHYGYEHLSKEEFVDQYGDSPWDTLNNTLKHAKLHFKILAPETFEINNPINIICENDKRDRFSIIDLSSGEKVLLALALSLYSAENGQMLIPKVILLDEVDSSLHPSMIQNLLSLIEDVFVNKYGIKVIMTTHSPTTIALAEEETIYYMQTDNDNRIIKECKDIALLRLAYGIPTLSVTYLNRKNVITESSYDAKNLENIYSVLVDANYLGSDISLNFIPSGLNGSQNTGDCNNVRNIVKGFESNSNVYGIIDWDLKNEPKEKVHVLAYNERYNIENCILDPVVIALLLLHDLKSIVNPEDFGLSARFNLNNMSEFNEKIQSVSNTIVSKVAAKLGKDTKKTTRVKYAGGIEINIPTEYLVFQGHELEETIQNLFPQLNNYKNANELKQALIRVLRFYPQFTPMCFVDVFSSIL